jgi:hypothetical protein
VAWVCISEDSRRVEEAESQLTQKLAKYIPVVRVITKARAEQGFRAEVQKLMPEARNIVRVRAIAEQLDEGFILQPPGLKDLVDLTMELGQKHIGTPSPLHRRPTWTLKVNAPKE